MILSAPDLLAHGEVMHRPDVAALIPGHGLEVHEPQLVDLPVDQHMELHAEISQERLLHHGAQQTAHQRRSADVELRGAQLRI